MRMPMSSPAATFIFLPVHVLTAENRGGMACIVTPPDDRHPECRRIMRLRFMNRVVMCTFRRIQLLIGLTGSRRLS